MSIPLAVLLICSGCLPSYIWLRYYLHKDCHPEPKRIIVLAFVLGILLAPLAIAAQWLFMYAVSRLAPGYDTSSSSIFFLWAAFSEEVVKFLAVFYLVYHSPEFDEPVDGMIYLISSAMGFAALENILMLFKNIPDGYSITFQILAFRFIGATLLHALASGLVGYFVALAFFHHHHSKKFIWFGIGCATLFHFCFNTLLMHFSPRDALFSSSSILFAMLIFVSILFSKMRDRSPGQLTQVIH